MIRPRNVPILLALAPVLPSLVGAWPTTVQAQEVGSATVVPIQVTGDPTSRFSMVILGDGYTADEIPKFREHVDKHLNILWSIEPFRSYRSYINVYAVEIISGESGINCDPEIREERTTPLGMSFGGGCTNINARGIGVNQPSARAYAAMATPSFDQILGIANTDTYGGIGGAVATTSGGNAIGPLITPHELGHSLGRLQDEYTYGGRGNPGGSYEGPEPPSIHHSILTEEAMMAAEAKWWRWLGEENEAGGVIGRFEGGQGNVSGLWRPSRHSMMISLGYYFDQVSLERMVERISAQVELIAASTPTNRRLPSDEVIWIETPQPVYHELEVTWRLNGVILPEASGSRYLALADLELGGGAHEVTVTVVDPTPFVRDPAIRAEALTATRSWTVIGEGAMELARIQPAAGRAPPQGPGAQAAQPRFVSSTQTDRPVGGTDVIAVSTTRPLDRVHPVTWTLNGTPVPLPAEARTFNLAAHLAARNIAGGTHTLTATVSDPQNPEAGATLSWVVDNTPPTVTYELGTPVASIERADGSSHHFVRDSFTMKLDAEDDQPGYVVAEFRVNGDGWHHYYGWPDAPPGTPYLFTPRGTNIKELIYGSLSSEGLSPQPWEAREPGWGTHRIEYRGIDAAGNIGPASAFVVSIEESAACTTTVTGAHAGDLAVSSGTTCLAPDAMVSGGVTVGSGASLIATGASIQGGVTADGAAVVELVNTRVGGPAGISGTTGSLSLFGSVFSGELSLSGNRTTRVPLVAGNSVGGALACAGNTNAPSNGGTENRVSGGATGECAGL